MTTKTYVCSNCGKSKAKSFKQIEIVFGWRNMGTVQRPQSQCRKCRNNKTKAPIWKKEMIKASKAYQKGLKKK